MCEREREGHRVREKGRREKEDFLPFLITDVSGG